MKKYFLMLFLLVGSLQASDIPTAPIVPNSPATYEQINSKRTIKDSHLEKLDTKIQELKYRVFLIQREITTFTQLGCHQAPRKNYLLYNLHSAIVRDREKINRLIGIRDKYLLENILTYDSE